MDFFYINLLQKARGFILKKKTLSQENQATNYKIDFQCLEVSKTIKEPSNNLSQWLGHLRKKRTWVAYLNPRRPRLGRARSSDKLTRVISQERSLSAMFKFKTSKRQSWNLISSRLSN